MTDIQLQKDIVTDLKAFLENQDIMMPLGDEFRMIPVYSQMVPAKQDKEDENLRNYIVVMISDEDVVGDEWNVEIHFSICIEDRTNERDGDINILYLMNEIYNHYIKVGIIGKHCKMEKEAHKRLNLETKFPFHEGDLITNWRLPIGNEEGLEGLI